VAAGNTPSTPKGAKPLLETICTAPASDNRAPQGAKTDSNPWHALWTYSHSEQLVHDQLAAKGLDAFVPTMDIWSRRRGVRHLVSVPMFPGYLFLRGALDKATYLKVRSVRGLVRVLGERWDRLAVIPEEQVEAIRRVSVSRQPVLPHPFLKTGHRARITRGALAGLEGILIEDRTSRGLLVLSVELLQRSVAVVVDCIDVEPA
jgi:transcription antitermination factor NusG